MIKKLAYHLLKGCIDITSIFVGKYTGPCYRRIQTKHLILAGMLYLPAIINKCTDKKNMETKVSISEETHQNHIDTVNNYFKPIKQIRAYIPNSNTIDELIENKDNPNSKFYMRIDTNSKKYLLPYFELKKNIYKSNSSRTIYEY